MIPIAVLVLKDLGWFALSVWRVPSALAIHLRHLLPKPLAHEPNKQYNSTERLRADVQRNSHPSNAGSDSHPTSIPCHFNPTA